MSSKRQLDLDVLIEAFNSSYDGIHILDREGNTIFINKACERIEGTPLTEVYSKNMRQLVEEGFYSDSVTLKVLDNKEPVSIVQTTKNHNQVLVTGTPVFDANGDIDLVFVNSRDVTELSNTKQELTIASEQVQKYQKEIELLRRERFENLGLIAKSQEMQHIVHLVNVVSNVDSNILITGESGVGKGALAKYVHSCSNRKDKPFVTIDCSAIPESLFESELFGYEKGAFTGANAKGKIGLLELADEGTVFLDEIGEIPLMMQVKLLRAIQEKQIMPVGGKTVKNLDIRIIAATNQNLEKMVQEGQFRYDLYYRLNVIPIDIPPLRERKDDILPLIQSFMDSLNRKYGWNSSLDNRVIDVMMKYPWPGNVRQLENVIERIMVSTQTEVISINDLPSDMLEEYDKKDICISDANDYKRLLRDYDKYLIEKTIEEEGSIVKAAEKLQIHVTTLRRKISRYNGD